MTVNVSWDSQVICSLTSFGLELLLEQWARCHLKQHPRPLFWQEMIDFVQNSMVLVCWWMNSTFVVTYQFLLTDSSPQSLLKVTWSQSQPFTSQHPSGYPSINWSLVLNCLHFIWKSQCSWWGQCSLDSWYRSNLTTVKSWLNSHTVGFWVSRWLTPFPTFKNWSEWFHLSGFHLSFTNS